jgi:hypothetical protein
MGVDFREHDARERGLPDRRDAALEFLPDPATVKRIRDGLNKHLEDAAFDAAERRMRGGARHG